MDIHQDRKNFQVFITDLVSQQRGKKKKEKSSCVSQQTKIMLLHIYVRGCCDLEPAISVVMTLEPAWEVLSLGRVRLEAQPQHSRSHLDRWWKSTSFPRSSLAGAVWPFPERLAKFSRKSLQDFTCWERSRSQTGTWPQTRWERFIEQEVSWKRAVNDLPENLNLLKRERNSRRTLYQWIERCIKKPRDCGLWQPLMKCRMREDDGKLSGKSSPSFLSPTVPGGWYCSWKNSSKTEPAFHKKHKQNTRMCNGED